MTGAVVQPGWYPDPQTPGVLRWWDGQQWTGQTAPLPAAAPYPQQPVPAYMVTREHKRTSHTFHLLMTIFTCGLWGIVWIWQTLWHRSHKGEQSVTHVGYQQGP